VRGLTLVSGRAQRVILKRYLVAQTDDDSIPFEAADGPEIVTDRAIAVDVRVRIEEPPQHTVRVALLQASIAALRAARHEWNELIHGPEAGALSPGHVPMTPITEVSNT
jgi:hypothetical protein